MAWYGGMPGQTTFGSSSYQTGSIAPPASQGFGTSAGPQGGYGPPPSAFPPPPMGGIDPNIVASFRAVDVNNDGSISALELLQAMRRSNWLFSPETAKMLVNMFDSDGNGTITLDEYERLHRYIVQMQSAFRQVDVDGSGSLDRGEVQRALQISRYHLSPQTFNTLFAKFDRRKVGTLGFDGYIELCVFIGTAQNCFNMYDVNRTGQALFNFDTFLFCANQCNFL